MLILSRPSIDTDVAIIPYGDGVVYALATSADKATARIVPQFEALRHVEDALPIIRDWHLSTRPTDMISIDLEKREMIARRSAHYAIFARRHNLRLI